MMSQPDFRSAKNSRFFFAALAVTVTLALVAALALGRPRPEALPFEEQKSLAAASIRKVFEEKSHRLSPAKRGHFYLRLYRVSGSAEYLPEITSYGLGLVGELKRHASNLSNPEYISEREKSYLKLPEKPLAKHRFRARYRERWPGMAFAHRLLSLCFQIRSLGLDGGEVAPDFDLAMTHLQSLTYDAYLADPEIIRYNATRAVNMVYQLKFLGLQDTEEIFLENFRAIFFAGPDAQMGATAYLNKIYGLTHMVIGASNFYQNPVEAERYRWIFDFFSQDVDQILVRTNPDMAAEVALCFKLAEQASAPAVKKIQEYLLRNMDWRKGYIPLQRKKSTLDAAEHRNILAYMVLSDWTELFSGPRL